MLSGAYMFHRAAYPAFAMVSGVHASSLLVARLAGEIRWCHSDLTNLFSELFWTYCFHPKYVSKLRPTVCQYDWTADFWLSQASGSPGWFLVAPDRHGDRAEMLLSGRLLLIVPPPFATHLSSSPSLRVSYLYKNSWNIPSKAFLLTV